jgi:hypothetical protein
MPLASHDPRPQRRAPSSRLGKNGGTQSKCVDSVTRGASSVASTLKRVASTGCSVTTKPRPLR